MIYITGQSTSIKSQIQAIFPRFALPTFWIVPYPFSTSLQPRLKLVNRHLVLKRRYYGIWWIGKRGKEHVVTCQHRDNGKQDLFNALNRRPPLYKMASKNKIRVNGLNSFMYVFCIPDPDEIADKVWNSRGCQLEKAKNYQMRVHSH